MKEYVKKENIKTNLKNYGVKNPIQSHIIKGSDKYYNIKKNYYENLVEDWLKINNIKYEKKDREIIEPFELDFLIPDKKIAIEVNDTKTHHSSFGYNGQPKDSNYHYDKTMLCKKIGYQLIHVFEKDLNQLDNIFHMLKHHKFYPENYLVYKHNVYVKDFIRENHRQHTCSLNNGGAFIHPKTGEIIGAITFKKYKDEIHLDKLCYRSAKPKKENEKRIEGVIIQNGLSSLIKNYIENEPETFPKGKKVVSYCDLTFNNGVGYEKAGFKPVSWTRNYWWVRGDEWRWRRSCQKKKICKEFNISEEYTENQIMESQGFVKIYDSGMNRYELII